MTEVDSAMQRTNGSGSEGLRAGALFQRYRLQDELGRGPLGTVYRAWDEESEQAVALKLFDARFRHEPGFAIRFRHLLKDIIGLDHRHLVAVLDYGLAGDHFYIVNELVDGLSLATLLAERGALAPGTTAGVARQICVGLGAAHDHGLVHRNLKPENVLLSRDDQVKVADVGLSSLLSKSGLSRTSVMLHGVDYMAPEQGRGQTAGPAADIYSAGVILFEMLTGRPPFASDDVWRIVQLHLQTSPPSARRLNAEVSPELEAVVARALSKESDDRFATADQMAASLAPLASEVGSFELTPASRQATTGRWQAMLPAVFARVQGRLKLLLSGRAVSGGPRRVRTAGLLLVAQFLVSFALTVLLLLALSG